MILFIFYKYIYEKIDFPKDIFVNIIYLAFAKNLPYKFNLIGINFSTEKIWHKWRKMAKIAKLNPRQI